MKKSNFTFRMGLFALAIFLITTNMACSSRSSQNSTLGSTGASDLGTDPFFTPTTGTGTGGSNFPDFGDLDIFSPEPVDEPADATASADTGNVQNPCGMNNMGMMSTGYMDGYSGLGDMAQSCMGMGNQSQFFALQTALGSLKHMDSCLQQVFAYAPQGSMSEAQVGFRFIMGQLALTRCFRDNQRGIQQKLQLAQLQQAQQAQAAAAQGDQAFFAAIQQLFQWLNE